MHHVSKRQYGTTALHECAACGHDRVADLLLQYGASPFLEDFRGVRAAWHPRALSGLVLEDDSHMHAAPTLANPHQKVFAAPCSHDGVRPTHLLCQTQASG